MRTKAAGARRRRGAGILVVALSLCACVPAEPAPSQLVVAQVARVKSLDPHRVTAVSDFRVLINLYEGLVRYKDGTLRVEPSLAECWSPAEDPDHRCTDPAYPGDSTHYYFRLRPGVRFHDGSKFDARSVQYNFERVIDPRHDRHPPEAATSPMYSVIREVEVMDPDAAHPRVVRFTLERPHAPFLSQLAYVGGLVVSPAALQQLGLEGFGEKPAGTGPFRFRSWKRNGDGSITLTRNRDYWRDDVPQLDTIVFRPLEDPVERVRALIGGEVDIVTEVPPELLEEIEADDELSTDQELGPHLWFLILNTRVPPFDDPSLRRAANLAIDRDRLIDEVLKGMAVKARGPISEGFRWAIDPTIEPYPYQPEAARALIQKTGLRGIRLKLLAPESGSGMLAPIAMARAVQRDLSSVGFQVEIETLPWEEYLNRVNEGLGDGEHLAEMAWMVDDPQTLLQLALHSSSAPPRGFNSGYYHHARVDEIIEAAEQASTLAQRRELYWELQRIVREDPPWVFMVSWKQDLVSRNRVRGFRLQPSFFFDLSRTQVLGADG